ncbi:MAG TPA: class I SAM-dependent methyltransferase [Mycobacteriales bacterium]|nr:class I SAM-dependent methyltransferase [Mycobacteriales bacterium]
MRSPDELPSPSYLAGILEGNFLVTNPVSGPNAPASPVATRAGSHAWLSQYARHRKLDYFFRAIPRDAAILDVGCADGWVRSWAQARGWTGVVGIDLRAPADIVGDITRWRELGLTARSFDVIVAFEVVEHGDLAAALHDLLKPDGMLVVTTPVPRMDWACRLMESAGLLQRRTGEHTHLVDLRAYPGFQVKERKVKGIVSQWGVLTPA